VHEHPFELRPMRVKALFGPLPADLRIMLGDEQVDVTNGVARITIEQGKETGFLPRVDLELSLVDVQVDGEAEVRLHISDSVRDALIALGWTPPGPAIPRLIVGDSSRLTEASDRIHDVLSAAFAYVDLPADLAADPEDEEHPGAVAYAHLAGTVERYRTFAQEVNG
jgi:hypothetical protein